MPDPRDNNRFGNNRNNFQNNRPVQSSSEDVVKQWKSTNLHYQSSWIKSEADNDLVEYAEIAGKQLASREYGLTTSKIRNIYGEIKRIQVGGFNANKSSFYLLKPKVAYALGRDNKNKGLILFSLIFNDCFNDVTDEQTYNNFCNFMEAILAYHKANGGD